MRPRGASTKCAMALIISALGAAQGSDERRAASIGLSGAQPPCCDPSPDDLGIRFNKVKFDRPYEIMLPLTMEDFPLDMETAKTLRKSQCVSVVLQEDCHQCDIDIVELINAVGEAPPHVSSDRKSPFWVEMREVVAVQQQRREGVLPWDVMPLPQIWSTAESMSEVAEYVHDELPGSHHSDLIRQLLSEGATVARDIVPSPSQVDFLRSVVMICCINTWAIGVVGPLNFAAKYHVGRARPEEVAWLIAQDELTTSDGVPRDVVRNIKTMNLESAVDFTAYPEGSPAHPSWPAMHSAASAGSLWLPVVLNLSDEQVCQTRLVDWGVSYGRTVAGVHYASDNIDGLNIGQEVIARKLADHLVAMYGSNRTAVEAKIAANRFDWNDFKNTDCFRDNIGKRPV